jgi:hypothetical protein
MTPLRGIQRTLCGSRWVRAPGSRLLPLRRDPRSRLGRRSRRNTRLGDRRAGLREQRLPVRGASGLGRGAARGGGVERHSAWRLPRRYGARQCLGDPEYFIPDFPNWKDHDSYAKAFDRLVRDLKAGAADRAVGPELRK